jgi:hypothetical protein
LLDYAAAAVISVVPDPAAFQVIRGAGAESETELPFAGLHMLLRPVLDRLKALPGPQQDALDAAFGLGRFALGTGS